MEYSLIDGKKEYKGFEILEERKVQNFNADGIYLRHKKTGLEIFHLLCDDKENLCAFCFRTPPEKSNGVPHILEHSVLCGSEKYPVKDPFIHLENQSLKTFLNAMTGCDKTMYPVSSVVEEDYFNLMSVYADSVFFPELKKEAFLQEGHHLEKNAQGEYSIQGVVYNEMKGAYSSFDSVAGDIIQQSILPDTIYELDSGGNPLVIPELTYDEYLNFYKEHYRADNCLLFLYGNIPTEKQLDFLQENLLTRIENKIESENLQLENSSNENLKSENKKITPLQKLRNQNPKNFSSINKVEAFAPSVLNSKKDENPSVIISWRLSESYNLEEYLEFGILYEVLTNHDGSPIIKALLESNLGSEISSVAGFDATTKFHYVSFGLDGVKKSNVQKVYDLVISEIEKLIQNGIAQDDVDSAIMSYEIALKEVVRHAGPFSLILMRRVLKSWIYGENPFNFLYIQDCFERIKSNIKNDSEYLQNLLKKYFIQNQQRSICVITPSPKYAKNFAEQESKIIENLKNQISDSDLENQIKLLREFQTKDESQNLKCLPHINARTLNYEIEQLHSDLRFIEYEKFDENKNQKIEKVPFSLNLENTNGIDYLKVSFPYDVLDADELDYLAFLTYSITEVGFAGRSWFEASSLVNKFSGGFGSSLLTSSSSKTSRGEKIKSKIQEFNLSERQWFCVSVKMIHEKMRECLDFFAECLQSPDFSDLKRLKNLFDEFLSDYESSVTSSGHYYAISRANSLMNVNKACDEINGGIENLLFLRKSKKDIKNLSKKLTEISKKIFSSGAIIHLITDKKNNQTEIVENLKAFAEKIQLTVPIQKNKNLTQEKIFEKVQLFKNNSKNDCNKDFEFFEKDIQIGFAAISFECSSYCTKEAVAESIFAHWLSNSLLWEQIRTVCGAYGAQAGLDSVERIFSIFTYRDPNPYKSLGVIEQCLKTASEKIFSEDEIQKAITGAFSSELRPRTPKQNGAIGFERLLYCIDQEDVNERILKTLQVTAEDVHNAAERLYSNYKKSARKVILNPKNNKIAGKNHKIEL